MSDEFDPRKWAEAFKANADRADRNSLMDSGWSQRTAQDCEARALRLYAELFRQLDDVNVRPEDFFDRPALAAVIAAVHMIRAPHGDTPASSPAPLIEPAMKSMADHARMAWAALVAAEDTIKHAVEDNLGAVTKRAPESGAGYARVIIHNAANVLGFLHGLIEASTALKQHLIEQGLNSVSGVHVPPMLPPDEST